VPNEIHDERGVKPDLMPLLVVEPSRSHIWTQVIRWFLRIEESKDDNAMATAAALSSAQNELITLS
jgi:hypothetical protein